MSTMDQWTAAVCADLGLDPSDADLRAVLDLTRDVAHGVARPAAPLTAYLVGMAVGRGLARAGRGRGLKTRVARPGPRRPAYRRSRPRGTVTGLLQIPSSPGGGQPASPKTVSRGRTRTSERRSMTPESMRDGGFSSGSEPDLSGDAQHHPRPTRRGVLLGVSLAGLGGALAGCSTAAVPYDA